MADDGHDAGRIIRWVIRKSYGIRNPSAAAIERYRFWHAVSRSPGGFTASGPWEHWLSREIPPDAVVPKPSPLPAPAVPAANGVAVECHKEPRRRRVEAAESATVPPVANRRVPCTAGSVSRSCTSNRAVTESGAFSPAIGAAFPAAKLDSIPTSEPKLNDTPPAPQAAEFSGHPEPPSQKRRGRPPKVRQARALLQKQLADGPKPGAEIEAAAQAAEIPKSDLLAATDARRAHPARAVVAAGGRLRPLLPLALPRAVLKAS